MYSADQIFGLPLRTPAFFLHPAHPRLLLGLLAKPFFPKKGTKEAIAETLGTGQGHCPWCGLATRFKRGNQ